MKLGVNIDHVATLRQARRAPYPNPLSLSREALQGGADFITFHLREDRRHIQDSDVIELISKLPCRTNLELSTATDIVELAISCKPSDCCIVPENRNEITTEGGLNLHDRKDALHNTKEKLECANIIVSAFIDPNPTMIELAHDMGFSVIELHSGKYANQQDESSFIELKEGAEYAASKNIQVNVGHGLTLPLLQKIREITCITECNIGHAIISDALIFGIKETVRRYKQALNGR